MANPWQWRKRMLGAAVAVWLGVFVFGEVWGVSVGLGLGVLLVRDGLRVREQALRPRLRDGQLSVTDKGIRR
tara:strand:+ start:323 stop:538 length:216 start_codon:yes stop_codon:yes gene_type:complete